MTAKTHYRINVKGQTVVAHTSCRYALVLLRTEPVKVEAGVLVPFAQVEFTTGDFAKAWNLLGKQVDGQGCELVILDLLSEDVYVKADKVASES